MNRIQTRALVEGAVFAAITAVIGIIKFYFPFIAVISIVWSVPTILIAFRHGLKVSVNSVIVSSMLVAVMTQPIEGLAFFIGFGLPGIIMGYLLKNKVSPGKTIFFAGLVFALSTVASIYLGMLVIGVDITQAYNQIFIDMQKAYSEAANSMADTYSRFGVSSEELLKGAAAFEKSMELLKLILPAGFFITGIIISFINFKLTKLVLRRINCFIEDVKPYSLWTLSNKSMVLVISMLLYVLVEIYVIKLPQLNTLTMNIFTVVSIIFVILGLSVTKFYLDKYSVPKALKGIIIIIVLVSFSNIFMIIGAADIIFDFRKLRNEPLVRM